MLSLIPAKAPWPFVRGGLTPVYDASLWSQISFSENQFIDDASDTILLPTSATVSKYKMTNTDINVASLDKIPPPYFTATEDYTIEGWINLNSVAAYGGTVLTIDNLGTGGDGNRSFMLSSFASGSVLSPYFFVSSHGNSPGPGVNALSGNTNFALNTDTHLAVCRKNGVITMFLNGKVVGSIADATAGYHSAEFMSVRRGGTGKRWGMRVLRGVAAYTAQFTPVKPQLPLAQYYDADTQKDIVFQACMRRNALINEVNGQPITLAGTAAVAYGRITTTPANASRFSAYCGYFGASDFTIECKVRLPVAPAVSDSCIMGQYLVSTKKGNSWQISLNTDGTIRLYMFPVSTGGQGGGDPLITSTLKLRINTDNHLVIERVGDQVVIYIDSVEAGRATFADPLYDASAVTPVRNFWESTASANTLQVTNIRMAKRAMYKGKVANGSTFLRIKPAYTGPGPQELKFGTPYCGYYGQVTEAELLGTADLATLVGITQGAKVAAPIWLKFASNGKVIFTPKAFIRENISWQAIYQAGCVYGLDSGTGLSPSGTAVQQTKKVQLAGSTFKVRLMRGANANPYPGASGEYNIQDPDASQTSEWSLLMYRVWNADPSGAFWEKFTQEELGSRDSRLSFCQETHPFGADYRVQRGYQGVQGIAASTSGNQAAAGFTSAWKPVLELVNGEVNVIKDGVISNFESVNVVPATPATNGMRFTAASGAYLKAVSPPEFAMGTGDFTFEIEFSLQSFYNNGNGLLVPFLYWGVYAAPGQGINYEIYYNQDTKNFGFVATYDTAADYRLAPFTVALNTMYKLQITRDNGLLQFWINGTKISESAFPKDVIMAANTPMYIGRRIGGSSANVNWYADMTVKTFRFVLRGLSKL